MKHISSLLLVFSFVLPWFSQAQPSEVAWVRTIQSVAPPDGDFPYVVDFFVSPSGHANLLFRCHESVKISDSLTVSMSPSDIYKLAWVKYSPSGEVVATKAFQPSLLVDNEYPSDRLGRMACDALGNTYMMAGGWHEIDLGNGVVVPAPSCTQCDPAFLAKIDPEGNTLWAKAFEVGYQQFMNVVGLSSDAQGNTYAAVNTGASSLTYDGVDIAIGTEPRGVLFKFDANGALLWYKLLKPTSFVSNVATNNEGLVCLSGKLLGSIEFGNGVAVDAPVTGNNYFFVRYLPDGTPVAATTINNSNYMYMPDMDLDNQGRLYMTMDLDGTLFWGDSALFTASNRAGAILAWDGTSVEMPSVSTYWVEGNPFEGIAAADDGHYFAAGTIGDPEIIVGQNTLVLDDCLDAVVMEGQLGTLPQAVNIGGKGCEGTVNWYNANVIDIDQDNNLYISGMFTQSGNLGGFLLGESGAFVAKLSEVSSIKEPANTLSLRLSPNPSDGHFYLQLGHIPTEGTVWVYDVSGQLVKNIPNIKTAQVPLDMDLPNGQYMVQFTDGQQTGVAKMTVLR